MKATTYSYRCYRTGGKILGGSIPANTTLEEASDYATKHLQIEALGPDRCCFLHNGKRVYAFLTLDPTQTAKGKAAMRTYAEAVERREREAERLQLDFNKEVERFVRRAGSLEIAQRVLKEAGERLNDN